MRRLAMLFALSSLLGTTIAVAPAGAGSDPHAWGRAAKDAQAGAAPPGGEPKTERFGDAGVGQRSDPGAVAWEDRFDANGFGQAFSVAATNGRVFAAGFGLGSRGRDFVVRAYDGRAGALLWMDRFDRGRDEFASGVVADASRVYVSGTGFVPGVGYDWILRAYDAASGQLLWEDGFDFAGASDFSRGTALALSDGRVFLGGYGTTPSGTTDWILRAHDAASGAVVWQDRRDVSGGDDGVYTVAAADGQVFAGGWGDTATTGNAYVRAFDTASGSVLWEHATPGAFGFTFTQDVEVAGGRVFAALAHFDDGSQRFAPLVQAHSVETGEIDWSRSFETGGDAQWLFDMAVGGGRVVLAGRGSTDCIFDRSPPSNCDAVLRSYDAATGDLRWEQVADLSGLDDVAEMVSIHGQDVFVLSQIAATHGVPGCCFIGQWLVQAFDGSRGDLLWQSVGGELESGVYNMAVDRGRLFIPGRAIDSDSGDWAFLIRAYDERAKRGDVDPLPFNPLPELVLSGTSGEASVTVPAEVVGAAAHGLILPETQPGSVADGDFAIHSVSAPSGARLLRIALFDEETDGNHDLDVYVFGPTGGFVGASGGLTSNERVDVVGPVEGEYTVIVDGFRTDGPDANYTLFAWSLGDADEGNMAVSGPTDGTIHLTWSGLVTGARYLGAISYSDSTHELGHTVVSIRT